MLTHDTDANRPQHHEPTQPQMCGLQSCVCSMWDQSATKQISLLTLLSITSWTLYVWPETWLQSEDTMSVTPCRYLFEHVAHSNHHGSGVNVLFRALYTVDHAKLWPASSFECLDLQLHSHSHRASSTLRLSIIYWLPSSSPNSQPFTIFLTKFKTSLNASEQCPVSSSLAISTCGIATTVIHTHELFTTL